MTTEPLLRVEGLTTSFATDRGRLRAVDGVSFELRAGETLGVVGESGSGKSVLVRSIMNILARNASIDAGRVIFDGRDVHNLSRSDAKHFWGTQMAMVFQDPMTSLNPVKKVGTHLTEAIRFHLGADKREARARALDLLEQVGIPEAARRLDDYPHQLSGGMRQRVVIAIALACRPKLLIADEPTTALDVTVQKQILDLLSRIQADTGMAMILITHDLGVVAGRADRIAVMYAGRVVEEAPTRPLFHEMRHPYTEALLRSIPRVEHASHTRLEVITGHPPDMVAPPDGCRFAPRCRSARSECLASGPVLVGDPSGHRWACHFPVGTAEGDAARQANLAAGITGAGTDLTAQAVS